MATERRIPPFPQVLLALLAPIAVGALLRFAGTGPSVPVIAKDLDSPDPEVRKDALDWLAEKRRIALTGRYVELLHDENDRVRRRALRTIYKMKNPQTAAAIDDAYRAGLIGPEDSFEALKNIGYPHVLPYLKAHVDDSDPEVATIAEEHYHNVLYALNQEFSFYTLGSPVYNDLGRVNATQAQVLRDAGMKFDAPAQ